MELNDAIKIVTDRFVYTSDPKILIGDVWKVDEPAADGKFHGDCEDFSLTVFWHMCDKNILSFILNVIILQTMKVYYVTTKNNGGHAVGCFNDLWFDNWTTKPLDKDSFLKVTGHRDPSIFTRINMIYYFILGFLFKKRN